MPTRPLNATAGSLLGFLHEGPMTGYDLVAVARERIGDFWSLTQSQVYRELAAMAEDGLVVAGERGRRDRRPYAVTDAGRAAFNEWVNREPGLESVRFPLLVTVAFGEYVQPERMHGFLERHHAVHVERLATYQAQRAEIGSTFGEVQPLSVAALDFGIAYEQAVVGWFETLGVSQKVGNRDSNP